MGKRILIIDGHPDPSEDRFTRALVHAYADGGEAGGHAVRRIRLADLDVPILRTRDEWRGEPPPGPIAAAQSDLEWCTHLALFYPLWLGDMPALLKAFLEQVLRPDFALREDAGPLRAGLLRGKSARIVVTMGMPSLFYRLYYRAHSVRSLKRNILNFVGIRPVRISLIGPVEGTSERRMGWIANMVLLGDAGE